MRSLRTEESTTILIYSVLTCLFFIAIVQARNHKPAACSSSCGDVENISYPFRLKGDPVGCGDPDYEVSCVNNKTILEIFPGKYYVNNISHDDHVIRLVDVNFANGSGCSLPSGSVVSDGDGVVKDFRFVTLGTNRVYTQFVKCSRNISQAANAYNYTAIPCLTRTNGTSYLYAIYDGGYLSYRHHQPSCSLVSVASSDYEEHIVKPLSYEAIMKQLQAGFDLGWSVQCRDCSLAGKSCGVDVRDLNLGTKPLPYQCQQEYKEPTELQIILIYVGIALGALIGVVLIVVLLVLRIRKCKKRRHREKNVQQSSTPTISNS